MTQGSHRLSGTFRNLQEPSYIHQIRQITANHSPPYQRHSIPTQLNPTVNSAPPNASKNTHDIPKIKKTLAEKKRDDKASYRSGANIPGSASGRSGVGSRFGGCEDGGDCGYDGCGGLYIGC